MPNPQQPPREVKEGPGRGPTKRRRSDILQMNVGFSAAAVGLFGPGVAGMIYGHMVGEKNAGIVFSFFPIITLPLCVVVALLLLAAFTK